MNRFTIYCTESQTKKAFKLGAPIRRVIDENVACAVIIEDGCYHTYEIPTTEQMVGWIESISTIQLHIEKQMLNSGTKYRIWVREECKPFSNIIKMFSYTSRREACIAAIDAALDYLEQKKRKITLKVGDKVKSNGKYADINQKLGDVVLTIRHIGKIPSSEKTMLWLKDVAGCFSADGFEIVKGE